VHECRDISKYARYAQKISISVREKPAASFHTLLPQDAEFIENSLAFRQAAAI